MRVNANSIRVGNVIEHQGKLWRVAKTAHTMPGKGGAFVQMELKELQSGTKLNERFRSSEDLTVARLDQKEYQFLYDEGDSLALMDNETYEQISVKKNLLIGDAAFLQDGMTLIVESSGEKVLGVELPEQVTLAVVETEPVVKGQTAASSNKPATLENGVRVMVPPFVNSGDKVVIRTSDCEYMERAKG